MSERTRVPSKPDGAEEAAVVTPASTYPTDGHGCILCPLCPAPKHVLGDCEAGYRGLFLTLEYTLPLDASDGTDWTYKPDQATTTSWRAECVNGHVLAVPCYEDSDEYAEQFSLDSLPAFTGYRRRFNPDVYLHPKDAEELREAFDG